MSTSVARCPRVPPSPHRAAESRRDRSGLARFLPIVAIIVPLTMFAGAAWVSWRSVWRDAAFAMQRSAESGAEYGARALDSYAVAMGRIHDRLTALSDADIRADEHDLHLELQRMLRDVPHAEAVLVLDRDGVALVSSALFPVDRATRHDPRSGVVALRGAAPPGLHIGTPMVRDRAGGGGFRSHAGTSAPAT